MCTLTFTRLEIWDLPLGIFTCSNPELSNLVKTNSVSLQTEQDRHRLNVFFTPLVLLFRRRHRAVPGCLIHPGYSLTLA